MVAIADDELGPGLHVLREVDPAKRAATMAAALAADLCATEDEAAAVLAARGSLPAIDRPGLDRLRRLARRLDRAEQVAARTRERAVEDAGARLSRATGLAVHPDTVRERATAVERAREELAAAEEALTDHHAQLVAVEAAAQEAAATADLEEEGPPAATEPSRAATLAARRNRAVGVLLASFGVALLVLALGVLPLWAALILPLVAALWALRHLRSDDGDDAYDRESSSFLAEVSAATDQVFGSQRTAREGEVRSAQLATRRSRAEEELRVAERAWRDLAGEGVETSEVEAVVRRFDPQHEDARLLADESVSVRAVEAVVRQLRERWHVSMEGLGVHGPTDDGGPPGDVVEDLATKVARPVVLVGAATACATELTRLAPAATIVVVDGPLEPDVALS